MNSVVLDDKQLALIGKETSEIVRHLPEETEGWEIFLGKDGVIASRKKVENSGRYIWKGVGEVPFPPWQIGNFILDINNPTPIDELWDHTDILRTIEEGKDVECKYRTTLEHSYYKRVLVTSPRDFVYITRNEQHGDMCLISGVSVDMQDNEGNGYVRGKMMSGTGWIIESKKQDNGTIHSLVTHFVDIDPCGYVPQFVLNFVGQQQPMIIASLRKILVERADLSIIPCTPFLENEKRSSF